VKRATMLEKYRGVGQSGAVGGTRPPNQWRGHRQQPAAVPRDMHW